MWKKGQSGNPGGRPKHKWRELLDKALIDVGKQQKPKTTPMKALAEAFYEDNTVKLGVLKTMLPQLKAVDAKISEDSPFQLIIDLSPRPTKPKQGAPKRPKRKANSNSG